MLMLHETDDGDHEIIVAKQRGGQCGLVPVDFDKPKYRFTDKVWVGDL